MKPEVSSQSINSLYQSDYPKSQPIQNKFLNERIEKRKENVDPKFSLQTFPSLSESIHIKGQPIKNDFSEQEVQMLRDKLYLRFVDDFVNLPNVKGIVYQSKNNSYLAQNLYDLAYDTISKYYDELTLEQQKIIPHKGHFVGEIAEHIGSFGGLFKGLLGKKN